MKDIIILCLLFVSFPQTLGQKQFCESFVKNDNSIDYGLQVPGFGQIPVYYLIIGSNIWKVNWDITKGSAHIESPSNGQENELFDSRYRVAFHNHMCSECVTRKTAKIGFLFRNNDTIDWVIVNLETLTQNEEKQRPESTQLTLTSDFKPTVGFYDGFRSIVLQQSSVQNKTGAKYSRKYIYFDFTGDNKVVPAGELLQENQPYEVMAIFSTEMQRLLFLLKDSQRILYCEKSESISEALVEEYQCIPFANQTLIDCTDNTTETVPTRETIPLTTPSAEEKNGSFLWIIIILVIVVVIALILVGIWFAVRYGQTTAPKQDNKSLKKSSEPNVAKDSELTKMESLPTVRSNSSSS